MSDQVWEIVKLLVEFLVVTVIPAVLASAWWARIKRGKWWGDVIANVAATAAKETETTIVQPWKSATGADALPSIQQALAKQNAMRIGQEVLVAAGKEVAPHILGAAIERAVAAMKPATAPEPAKALFP